MLWLYNDNNPLNFYQIFLENKLVYEDNDSNLIYSLETTNLINTTNLLKFGFNINLSDYTCDNEECEIKIIDNIISYNFLLKNKNRKFVFLTKTNFIKSENNQLKIPIFSNAYKSISVKKMPNLIDTEYNFSQVLNLKIYKLDSDNKIQYIIETNTKTNTIRNYFITVDLNLLKKFQIF